MRLWYKPRNGRIFVSAERIFKRVFGEVRFIGVLRESPPLHFYLLQAVTFFYMFWRFASRDYTVYGFLADQAFDYPRPRIMEVWAVPPSHLFSFQFIYSWIPHPGPEVIFFMQLAIVLACFCGLLGFKPRFMAAFSFLFAVHITGMMQASNAEIDGGTLVLVSMLILAIAPGRAHYRSIFRWDLTKKGVEFHWPIFLFMFTVGCFYSMSGLNKLVEGGVMWPLTLHLERLAITGEENALFLSSRFVLPQISAMHHSYTFSVISGVITLTGELFFISILWLPRWRPFFVLTMAGLHLLVFVMAGINFMGSVLLLLLCFEWNRRVKDSDLESIEMGIAHDDGPEHDVRS